MCVSEIIFDIANENLLATFFFHNIFDFILNLPPLASVPLTAPKLQEEPPPTLPAPSSVKYVSETECSSPVPADDSTDLLQKGIEEVPASSKLHKEPAPTLPAPSSVECVSETECSSPVPADDSTDLLQKGIEEVPASSKLQEEPASSSVECVSETECSSPVPADDSNDLLEKGIEEVPASSNAVNGHDILDKSKTEIDVSSYLPY